MARHTCLGRHCWKRCQQKTAKTHTPQARVYPGTLFDPAPVLPQLTAISSEAGRGPHDTRTPSNSASFPHYPAMHTTVAS
jgi:hypothetical protein